MLLFWTCGFGRKLFQFLVVKKMFENTKSKTLEDKKADKKKQGFFLKFLIFKLYNVYFWPKLWFLML